MGYTVRAPKLTVLLSLMGAGKKSSSSPASPPSPLHESLKEALLQEFYGESTAAEVPKGCMAVYVGVEMRRFVIPTSYLCMPEFRPLMEKVAEEFGFEQAGGLRIPCEEEDFEEVLRVLEAAAAAEKKKTSKKSKKKLD